MCLAADRLAHRPPQNAMHESDSAGRRCSCHRRVPHAGFKVEAEVPFFATHATKSINGEATDHRNARAAVLQNQEGPRD